MKKYRVVTPFHYGDVYFSNKRKAKKFYERYWLHYTGVWHTLKEKWIK